MIKYETKCQVTVEVDGMDEFKVYAYGRDDRFSRAQLTEFRNAIDQALNTSQDEIDAAA